MVWSGKKPGIYRDWDSCKDYHTSGTRRDELLYSETEYDALTILRRRAVAALPRPAMDGMLKLMEKWETNEALLAGISGSWS